jgi:hypothetical protein
MLTFELTKDKDEIEIHGDQEGLSRLVGIISRIIKSSGHDHLMTPAWGGSELTSEKQGQTNTLVNKVTVRNWSKR